jgi:hypothetical protein
MVPVAGIEPATFGLQIRAICSQILIRFHPKLAEICEFSDIVCGCSNGQARFLAITGAKERTSLARRDNGFSR